MLHRVVFTITVLLANLAPNLSLAQVGGVDGAFDSYGHFLTEAPLALPADTTRDLFGIGRGQFDPRAAVSGFEAPLAPEVFDATRQFFDPQSEELRVLGEAQLSELAAEHPEVGVILASGYLTNWIDQPIDDQALQWLATSAKAGNPLAQQALTIEYVNKHLGNPDQAQQLEAEFTSGLNLEVGQALALKYQYGIGGELDPIKAESIWRQVVREGNPATQFGFGEFLLQQGDTEEAVRYFTLAAASDFAPAIVKSFELAWRDNDTAEIARLLPRLENTALDEREAALVAGDYYRSLATVDPWPTAEPLQKALHFYRLAVTASGGPDIFLARGMSRIAEIYENFPEHRPTDWDYEVRRLLNQAAALGDAGGFLGLAKRARDAHAYEAAYGLASRAAELGDELQSAEARALLNEVCQPGLWQVRCAPVPVFFVTTRKTDPNGPLGFGGDDSEARDPTFGIAFAQVPILSEDYASRQALYEAGRTAVARMFGDAALSRLATGAEFVVFAGAERVAWTEAAREAAAAVKVNGAFAFVHGYQNAFDAAIRTTAETMEKAGFPSLPVALSWPSAGSLQDYGQDVGRVDMACPRLFEGLKALGDAFGGGNLTLMAHSMGSRVVYDMVIGCDQAPESAWPHETIGNLIYAAPDMPRYTFEEKLDFMTSRASHVTLYVTSNDAALALSSSSWVNKTVRAGQNLAGRGPIVAQGVDTVDATEVEAGLLEAALTINFNHGYVFSRPQVSADLGQLLNFEFDITERNCLKSAGLVPDYWRIRVDCEL